MHRTQSQSRRFDDLAPTPVLIRRAAILTCLALLMIWLSGCAALSSALSAAEERDLGIRIATAEYIGGDIDTAERVGQLAADAQARLDSDISINLDRLSTEADAMIPWHRMSPGQRIIAEELFYLIEQRLAALVIEGELPPDGVASLKSILASIERTAVRERAIAAADRNSL